MILSWINRHSNGETMLSLRDVGSIENMIEESVFNRRREFSTLRSSAMAGSF